MPSPCSKHLSFSILLLIVLAFAASTNAMNPMGMNPVMLSFYRRQQCERAFEMCKMTALGEYAMPLGCPSGRVILKICADAAFDRILASPSNRTGH